MMDGFDVRGLRAERTYDIDRRVGNYLIVAGYAVQIEDAGLNGASEDPSEPAR